MESLHDDHLALQVLTSDEVDPVRHDIAEAQPLLREDGEPVNIDFYSGRTDGDNELVPAPILTIDTSPVRKTHSAAPTVNGISDISKYLENPRPYTAAGADALPSSSGIMTRNRKKKTAAVSKKATADNQTPREDRPRSADVNGWGDFDTDRLLRDEPEQEQSRSNQMPLDPLDGQRSRSRKSRRSTPITASPRLNPWEGYLTFDNERKESARTQMQVLRQKPMEMLNLELVALPTQLSARAGTTPKPLLGRVSVERLKSSQSRPAMSYMTRPAKPAPLFGIDIPETPENRATVFNRLAPLWQLISLRPLSSSPEQPWMGVLSGSVGSAPIAQNRSPFECSMTMVRVCKTVGISLTPSSATHLSIWYANEEGVDFEAFCNLVVQGAIQPALHHFHMDQSFNEYLSAVDTIVQSLMTTVPVQSSKGQSTTSDGPQRLRELAEIEPIFPNCRAGITPHLVKSTEDANPVPTRALVTAKDLRRAIEASPSQRMLAHQLPLEEARITHVENIRRKVQLHKSWKFISDGKIVERGALRSNPNVQMIRGSSTTNSEGQGDTSTTLNSQRATTHERAHSVTRKTPDPRPTEFPPVDGDHPELLVEQSGAGGTNNAKQEVPEPSQEITPENEQVLVCCSCSVRGAVLWCSACFTVSCQKCWQDFHSCTVDMSLVSSSANMPLIGPAALTIKKKRSGSATLTPPVAMVYLPTKAMVSGKLARGNAIILYRDANAGRKDVFASVSKNSQQIDGVVAHAILPSLHKSRSDGTILKHYDRPQDENTTPVTESTADLVKSLMLRMSPSTPTSGSHSSGVHTSIESVTQMHKHHAPVRKNLHLAPVSLDADLLPSHAPGRRR